MPRFGFGFGFGGHRRKAAVAIQPVLSAFTRASTATFIGDDGLLQTAAIDTARYDHSLIAGEWLGLLIEPASTNTLLRSNDLTHAAWGTFANGTGSISRTASVHLAPDGVSGCTEVTINRAD
ncbi:hypothetical protein, partial [Novosphingobium sp.]|uniref:hypothetical protein n=1 Tax=Novosphingobium sp. TaxID=1874826 RepID=UPI00286E9288